MFTTRFPSPPEVLACAIRAHRLRGAAVVSLIRELLSAARLRR